MCVYFKLKCQHRDRRVNLTCDELYLTSLQVIELNLKRSGKHCTASNTPENCISEASSEFRRLHDDDVKEGRKPGVVVQRSIQKSFLFQCMSDTSKGEAAGLFGRDAAVNQNTVNLYLCRLQLRAG